LEPLQQALALQPRLLEARLTLAEAYEALGQLAEAEKAYQDLLDQDPVHHPSAWNNLGLLYLQQQRVAEAGPMFEQAIALDPNLTIAIVNLGSVRLIEQDLAAATVLFERALQQEPDNVSALGNLGLIQAQQGNYAEARDLIRRVLSITPNDQRAQAVLAQIEEQLR
jgi:Tfp pilus assembly protein PilF